MDAEEAAVVGRDPGQPQFGLTARFIAALAAAMRGEPPDIEATLAHPEMTPLTSKSGPLMATAHLARGAFAIGEGRYDAAFEHLWPVFDERDPVFHRSIPCPPVPDRVVPAVRTGTAARLPAGAA